MEDAKDIRKGWYCLCSVITFLGMLLMVILLPLSYSKLEYYQHGIVQQKSTSRVDRDTVYASGSWCIGPDYTFKVFETNALSFDDTIDVWTKATGDDAGATLSMDVSFQYRINPNEIGTLYEQLGTDYEPMVRSYAIDALRNTAPLFGADDFLEKRAFVERTMAANVSVAVAKVHGTVLSLQLRRVNFEDDYKDVKLTTAIQQELNEAEEFKQQSQLTRLETDVDAAVVENQALDVKMKALAQADLIVARANVNFDNERETARNAALSDMYSDLGITTEAQRASLDYILMLTTKDTSTMDAFVDFNGGVAWNR